MKQAITFGIFHEENRAQIEMQPNKIQNTPPASQAQKKPIGKLYCRRRRLTTYFILPSMASYCEILRARGRLSTKSFTQALISLLFFTTWMLTISNDCNSLLGLMFSTFDVFLSIKRKSNIGYALTAAKQNPRVYRSNAGPSLISNQSTSIQAYQKIEQDRGKGKKCDHWPLVYYLTVVHIVLISFAFKTNAIGKLD